MRQSKDHVFPRRIFGRLIVPDDITPVDTNLRLVQLPVELLVPCVELTGIEVRRPLKRVIENERVKVSPPVTLVNSFKLDLTVNNSRRSGEMSWKFFSTCIRPTKILCVLNNSIINWNDSTEYFLPSSISQVPVFAIRSHSNLC